MKALGIIYSEVFFLDGKLVQRNKNRVYAQPDYGFVETIDPGGRVNIATTPSPAIVLGAMWHSEVGIFSGR